MRANLVLAALAAAVLSACVPQTRYHWGNYDNALYQHYKNPQDREVWAESLKTTILDAEQGGQKVPPGMYAEYGYALFEEGQGQAAVPWFQKEKATWPESAVLMDKMIRNAERRGPASPAKGPAGALEKKP
jgi:hypothetical protein